MYDIKEEDMDIVIDRSQSSMESQSSSLQTQLPVLELLKVRVCYYCFILSHMQQVSMDFNL